MDSRSRSLRQPWDSVNAGELSRRDVLRGALYLGLSVPVVTTLLAACGDDDGDDADDETTEDPVDEPDDAADDPGDDEDVDDESTDGADDPDDDDDQNLSDDRELRIARHGGLPNQDPQASYDGSMVFLATYEMLIRLDGESTSEYQPMLAREWESNEDLTEYTFTIAEGAMFHDGTVCDAEAVKRSFVRFREMGRGPVSVISRFIDDPDEQIEVVDDVTVRFVMNRPQPLFLPAMASAYGPYVVSPTAWDENRTDADPYAHDYFSQNMVGTGPYRVVEAEPQERFVLDRFDDYHSEAPFFDRITVRIVPEDATRRSLLESGEVDAVTELPMEDYLALEDDPNVQVIDYETSETRWIRINHGLIEDPQARLGFAHAFPYDEVNEQIYLGRAFQQGPVADTVIGYSPDVALHETDLDLASELLAEGGIQEGDTFSLMYEGGHASLSAVVELFQANLAQIGINLDLQQVDYAAFWDLEFSDAPPEERPHFSLGYWWPDYNDSWNQLYPNFHSDSHGSAGANSMYYSNDEFDEYLDQMRDAETEDELIEAAGNALQIIMWDDPGAIFYQQIIGTTCLGGEIRGFVPNGIYINLYNFHEMWREA